MNLSDLPAHLLYSRNMAHEAHLTVTGKTAPQDHQLLQKIYDELDKEYDLTCELMIGAGVKTDRRTIHNAAAEKLRDAGGYLNSGDADAVLRCVRQNEASLVLLVSKLLEGTLPHPGLETHLQDLLKTSLHRTYFLSSRLTA